MSYKVDNAVIMAAGTASRFAPLSYEMPKALIEVRGDVLIERQIRQLKEAGVSDIIIVVGYKKERFYYLKEKFGVQIVENNEYLTRNNTGSIYAAREYLRNTYICSSDNYFAENPFEKVVEDTYYAAVYAEGHTNEWCMQEDEAGNICSIKIGGDNAWYMMGHTFWNKEFSERFMSILGAEYDNPQVRESLWERVLSHHLSELKMKIRRYDKNMIFEFDTLEELRKFDSSYIDNTRSYILKRIAEQLKCQEWEIINVNSFRNPDDGTQGFLFQVGQCLYEYRYDNNECKRIGS